MASQVTGPLADLPADLPALRPAELTEALGLCSARSFVADADGTNVESKHQSGEGADLWFVDKSGKPFAPKASDPLWDVLGRIAKEEGLVWGGDWKGTPGKSVGRDPAHVQLGRELKRNR